MTDIEFNEFRNKIGNLMIISAVLWLVIIIAQFFIGIFTLVFGYGIATLLIMIYNIVNLVRYFKSISRIKSKTNYVGREAFYNYFSNGFGISVIFMFINLILGGVVGFLGNLYDMILSLYVTNKKEAILNPALNNLD